MYVAIFSNLELAKSKLQLHYLFCGKLKDMYLPVKLK